MQGRYEDGNSSCLYLLDGSWRQIGRFRKSLLGQSGSLSFSLNI
jgi:hypothetical protein